MSVNVSLPAPTGEVLDPRESWDQRCRGRGRRGGDERDHPAVGSVDRPLGVGARSDECVGTESTVDRAGEGDAVAELEGIGPGAAGEVTHADELGEGRGRLAGRGDRAAVALGDRPGRVGVGADQGVGAAAAVDRAGEAAAGQERERVGARAARSGS